LPFLLYYSFPTICNVDTFSGGLAIHSASIEGIDGWPLACSAVNVLPSVLALPFNSNTDLYVCIINAAKLVISDEFPQIASVILGKFITKVGIDTRPCGCWQ